MMNEGYYLEVEIDSSSERTLYYCLDKDIK